MRRSRDIAATRRLRRGVTARLLAVGFGAVAGVLASPPMASAAISAMVGPPGSAGVRGAPCDVPVVSVACDAVGGLLDAGAAVPAAVGDRMIDGIATWVASGAADLIARAGEAISASTTPSLAGGDGDRRAWFLDRYRLMAGLAVLVMAPMLLLAALQAAVTAQGSLLGRALINLPIATLGTAAALTVTQLLLGVTDWASAQLAAAVPGDAADALHGVAAALLHPAAVPGGLAVGGFGLALVAVFMAVVAFVVWLELIVREAAIYLTVLFLPLGFATYVWPALSAWLRRLVEIIVALVLSKLVIVAALALAGSALAHQEGPGTLVAGAGMLLLAAFAPFALFKLVPIASMAGISSLEGLGRRAPRALTPRLSTVNQARHLAAVNALPASVGSGSPVGGGGSGRSGRMPPPPPPIGPTAPSLPRGPSGGGGSVAQTGAAGAVAVAGAAMAAGARTVAQTRRLDPPLPFPEGGKGR